MSAGVLRYRFKVSMCWVFVRPSLVCSKFLTPFSDFCRDRHKKSRNGSSGSAKKAGYGAAGSSQTMVSDEGKVQSRMPSSKSHSPRRRKRRSWGYSELRESLGESLGFGDFVMKHVGGGEGAWRGVKEENKEQELKEGDDDRKGEEMADDDGGSVEGKVDDDGGSVEGNEDTNEDEHAGSAPTVIFKERWKKKEARLRVTSKLGRAVPARWRLMPIIGENGVLQKWWRLGGGVGGLILSIRRPMYISLFVYTAPAKGMFTAVTFLFYVSYTCVLLRQIY